VVPKGMVAKIYYKVSSEDGAVVNRTKGDAYQFVVGAGEVLAGWDIGVST
jgi:FKBP-type peptidyl-prolyl cis-trans isomerase 2